MQFSAQFSLRVIWKQPLCDINTRVRLRTSDPPLPRSWREAFYGTGVMLLLLLLIVEHHDHPVSPPHVLPSHSGCYPYMAGGAMNPLQMQDFRSRYHVPSEGSFSYSNHPKTLMPSTSTAGDFPHDSRAMQPTNITHPIFDTVIQESDNSVHAPNGGTYPQGSHPNTTIGTENPLQLQDFSSRHTQSGGIFPNGSHPGTLHGSQALQPPNITHPILHPPIQDFRSSHHVQSGGIFLNSSHPGALHGSQALQPPNIIHPILNPSIQEFRNRTHASDGGTYSLASRPNIAVGAENPFQIQDFRSSHQIQTGGNFPNGSHLGILHGSQALQPPNIAHPILYPPIQEFNNRTQASDGGTYPLVSRPNIAVAAENPLQMQGFKSSDHMQSGGIFSNGSHPGTSHGSQVLQPPNITNPILYPPIQELNNRTDASNGGIYPLGGRPNIAVGAANPLQMLDFRSSHHIQSGGNFPNGSHPGILHGSQALQPPNITRPILYPPIQEFNNRTHALDGGTYPLASRPNIAVAAENSLQMQGFKSSDHMQSGGIFSNGSNPGTSHGSQALQSSNITHPILYPIQEFNNRTDASDGGTYPLGCHPNIAVGAENPLQMQDFKSSRHMQSGGIFPNGSHPETSHGSQALQPPNITHPTLLPRTQEFNNRTHTSDGGTYPVTGRPNTAVGAENPSQMQDSRSSHHVQSGGIFPNGSHPGSLAPSTSTRGDLQHGSQALRPPSITHPVFNPPIQEYRNKTYAPNGGPYPQGQSPNINSGSENPPQVQDFKSSHHIQSEGSFPNGNHPGTHVPSTIIGGNLQHGSQASQPCSITHPTFYPPIQEFDNRTHAPNGAPYPQGHCPNIAIDAEHPVQVQGFKSGQYIPNGVFSNGNHQLPLIQSRIGGNSPHGSRALQLPGITHPMFYPHIQDLKNSYHVPSGGNFSYGNHPKTLLPVPNTSVGGNFTYGSRALQPSSILHPASYPNFQEFNNRARAPNGRTYPHESPFEIAMGFENPLQMQDSKCMYHIQDGRKFSYYNRSMMLIPSASDGGRFLHESREWQPPYSSHPIFYPHIQEFADRAHVQNGGTYSQGRHLDIPVDAAAFQMQNKGLAYYYRVANREASLGGSEVDPEQEIPGPDHGNKKPAGSATREEAAEEAAAEALHNSFGAGSYARKVLESMGWKEGEALGKKKKGLLEPLKVSRHKGCTGLGWNKKRRKIRDEKEVTVPVHSVGDEMKDLVPVNCAEDETEGLVTVDCVQDGIKDLVPSECVQDDSEDPIPVDTVCKETEDLVPVDYARDETEDLVPVDCVRDGKKDFVISDCVQDDSEDPIPVENVCNETEDLVPADCRDETEDLVPSDCVRDDPEDPIPVDNVRNETEELVPVDCVQDVIKDLVLSDCVEDDSEDPIPVDNVRNETEDLVPVNCAGYETEGLVPVDCVRAGIIDLVPSDCVQDDSEDPIPVDNARNETEDFISVDYARDKTKVFIPVDCVQDELEESVLADSVQNETEGAVSIDCVGNETEALVSGRCVGDEAEGSIPVDCVGDKTVVSIQCVGDGTQDHAPVHSDAYN